MTVLLDSTLREGELFRILKQSAKIDLVEKLADAGLKRIELTLDYPPRTTRSDVEPLVSLCNQLGVESVIHGRALKDDVLSASKYEATGVAFYIAPTDVHRRYKLHGISYEEAIERLCEAATMARQFGFKYVRATIEDASRFFVENRMAQLVDAVKKLHQAGATLVSIPDTAGMLSPRKAAEFIRTVKNQTGVPLAAHFHNDYGMASSNTIEAVLEGADEAHTTIMGIGDRNGIADLYEVVAVLEDVFSYSTGIDRDKLNGLYSFFAKVAGIKLPWRHPLSDEAKTIRAGVHQSMAVEKPEGYMPKKKLEHDVANPVFHIGLYTSHRLVAALTGLSPSDPKVRQATEAIVKKSREKNNGLSYNDLREILLKELGFEVEREKIMRYLSGEKVYVLAKLNPQYDPVKIYEVLASWDDVEAIDEVYGDVDLVIVGRMKLTADNFVERLRDLFADALQDLKILVAD
ncbi:MAG: hypothetical protein NZ581_06265 [Candidatus Caldarchaeum sp.]|nr:hypothetical protein [Candidatus Caldarchaeum sp.]MDW8435784.1 hypothetical protein [Candidatus Caldarchaeum sp.]